MNLLDFSATFLKLEKKPKVILFQHKQYQPLAFFSLLQWVIKQHHISFAVIEKLDTDHAISELKNQLYTTFLGQQSLYWFIESESILIKKSKDFFDLITIYQGEHTIIGWVNHDIVLENNADIMVVRIDDGYTHAQMIHFSFLYQDAHRESLAYFYGKVFRQKKLVTLQEICLLKNYATCIGKNVDLFFEQWFGLITEAETSLFQLAQFFFEKKAQRFFEYWALIKGQYPEQFWISFFSDQLFKAHGIVSLQGKVDQTHKHLMYGLPFSFIKYDWKMFSLSELQQAHQALYEVDCAIKNGESTHLLDAFLVKFFA